MMRLNNAIMNLDFDVERPILHFDKLFVSQENTQIILEKFSTIKWQADAKSKSKVLDIKPIEKNFSKL